MVAWSLFSCSPLHVAGSNHQTRSSRKRGKKMLQPKKELSASKNAPDGELKALPSGMENLPLLLTSSCVCKLRNCHAGTVRRARKYGLIKARRINARVFLYERDSVLRWLGFLPGET